MSEVSIIMLSGKQGSGKTTLSTELVRIGPRLGFHFSGAIKFADALYEMHNFILNKTDSMVNEKGRGALEFLPHILHDYLLNKMHGWTGIMLEPQDDLEKFLEGWLFKKMEAGKLNDTSKDGPLLQYLGTEFGRAKYGKNVWCDILRKRIEKNDFGGWEKGKKYNPKGLPDNSDRLVIIDDCRFENEFEAFPEALRVRLLCPEENRKDRAESWRDNTAHQSETDLDKYSDQGAFDLYLDTLTVKPEDCGSLVAAQIQKNSWKEKRKEFVKALEQL